MSPKAENPASIELSALGLNTEARETAEDVEEALPLPEKAIAHGIGEGLQESLIEFEGFDDRTNPVHWSPSYKWSIVVLLSAVNLIA